MAVLHIHSGAVNAAIDFVTDAMTSPWSSVRHAKTSFVEPALVQRMLNAARFVDSFVVTVQNESLSRAIHAMSKIATNASLSRGAPSAVEIFAKSVFLEDAIADVQAVGVSFAPSALTRKGNAIFVAKHFARSAFHNPNVVCARDLIVKPAVGNGLKAHLIFAVKEHAASFIDRDEWKIWPGLTF